MDMEVTAWMSMYHAMHAQEDKRPFSKATLRRIAAFARPHRRKLAAFIFLSVVTAVLAVATPVLAGRVVNEIVEEAEQNVVISLALLIALIAVTEAGVGLVSRWLSATIGEALILDLRTTVFDHVQRMPIAFFTRTRTGALVSRLNNDVIGAQRAFSDTLSGVVGNIVTLLLTLVVMVGISWQITLIALLLLPGVRVPGPEDGNTPRSTRARSRKPQLSYEHPDDRAILGPRCDPRETLRPSGRGVGRVRRPRGTCARHRCSHGDGAVGFRDRTDTGVGARARSRLRARWFLRAAGGARAGRGGRAGTAVNSPLCSANGAGKRSCRGDERAGELRARVRGVGSQA